MAEIVESISGGSSAIGQVGSNLLRRLISGGLVGILVIVLSGVIIGTAWYVRYLMQFIYDVEIKSLRSSGNMKEASYKIIKDKGAFIRKRRDKSVWFRLKGQSVDLPPPPFECIQLGAKGKNYVKILQLSDEEYYYCTPDNIDTSSVIRNGKPIVLGQETVKVLDGDVAYWNIQRKKESRKLFDMESLAMKILPYVGLMVMFLTIVFLSYFMTQHWGEFATAAQALERAANALSQTTTATVTPG